MTDNRARPGTPGAVERLLAEYIAAKLDAIPAGPGPMGANPAPPAAAELDGPDPAGEFADVYRRHGARQ